MRGWGAALARRVAGVGRRAARGWWQLARWPAVATQQPAHRPTAPVDRSEATMSKLTRALVLGATLAAMNLAGHDHRRPGPSHTQKPRTPGGRPANAKSARPGATARPQHRSRPPSPMPPSSGSWPESATPSPAGHPPRCPPQCPPNRAGHPAGSSLPWVSWPPPLRSPAGWPCWPPGGPAAEPGSGTRPDHDHGHAARWGCRAHRQPHRLADTVQRIPARGNGTFGAPVRTRLLERITWPLTLSATWGNAGPHSAEPSIADEDEGVHMPIPPPNGRVDGRFQMTRPSSPAVARVLRSGRATPQAPGKCAAGSAHQLPGLDVPQGDRPVSAGRRTTSMVPSRLKAIRAMGPMPGASGSPDWAEGVGIADDHGAVRAGAGQQRAVRAVGDAFDLGHVPGQRVA